MKIIQGGCSSAGITYILLHYYCNDNVCFTMKVNKSNSQRADKCYFHIYMKTILYIEVTYP